MNPSARELGSNDSCQKTFALVPLDVFVEIALGIDAFDILSLRRTCKALSEYTFAKILWLTLAREIIQRRPLPIPANISLTDIPSPTLERAVLRAHLVERSWVPLPSQCSPSPMSSRPSSFAPAPLARPARVIDLPTEIYGERVDEERFWFDRTILHVSVVPGGTYAILLTRAGVLACWDLRRGRSVASYQCPEGTPSRLLHEWRLLPAADGNSVTIAMLLTDDIPVHPRRHKLCIIDLCLPDTSPARFAMRCAPVIASQYVDSIFIGEQLTGAVGFEERYELHLLDPNTCDLVMWEGPRNNEIPFAESVSAVVTPLHLILYSQGEGLKEIRWYLIQDLFEPASLQSPHNSLRRLPPPQMRVTVDRYEPHYELRPLWGNPVDGASTMFSMASDTGSRIKAVLFQLPTSAFQPLIPHPLEPLLSRRSRVPSGRQNVWGLGTLGKHMVFAVQDHDNDAQFPVYVVTYPSYCEAGVHAAGQRTAVMRRLELPRNLPIGSLSNLAIDETTGVIVAITFSGELWTLEYA